MNYIKETGYFKSNNQYSQIAYYIYKPLNKPKAIFQISHGMCEYIERYEPFINFLASHDILVCGNDHLGHKNSADCKENLGYFSFSDGWKCLVKDLVSMTKIIKKQYPNIPIFLFGHSMGSFVARFYITKYSHLIDGAIICGTSGSNPLIEFGQLITTFVKKLKGDFYRSKLIQYFMFGTYNSKYKNVKTTHDWLTRDNSIINNFLKDDYCTFIFTASAFHDLVMLLKVVSSKNWYNAVPKNLPIYLISGDMDPVGNWGKGMKEVKRKLEKKNLEDFSSKLYKDFRHEILNEIDKEVVYKDILTWLNQRI